MNIEYTPEQITAIEAKQDEIRADALAAREAANRALKLLHELSSLHTAAALAHLKRGIAQATGSTQNPPEE